ncbi:MAG TPA: DNA translocase FtsK 4TM domain-containing protein, partial [Burkholderiales bacterium]|nr:DNA translocase FtsK 4TM domain-containing protein [Burkholderiales bacterium]
MIGSNKAASRDQVAANPLPPKIAALLRESWWLALVAVALYLLLVLVTYSAADPGWSHSVRSDAVRNAGGVIGAYVADLLLYLFGVSAYWWIALCGGLVAWGFRRIESTSESDRRSYVVVLAGFALLLIASSGIEAVRLHTLKAALPLAPGGMIGEIFGHAVQRALGFTGGTLVLVLTFAAGLSLFSGLSWLTVLERLGDWTERGAAFVLAKWRERQDRNVGEQAVMERDDVVLETRKKLVIHEPLRIEPPRVEIAKSQRAEREKQVPLFDNLPDSMLPPLAILDQAERSVEVMSAETLEFTSRLIEKKLLDFGVEVKVVAAYPGPVIT